MIRLYWSHCFGVAAAMEDSVGGGVVVVRRWNPRPNVSFATLAVGV